MVGLSSSFDPSGGDCPSVAPRFSARWADALARRSPDHETESVLLRTCLTALAESPRDALSDMPATMLDLFQAGSAGLSVVSDEAGTRRFTWTAIAGEWSRYVGLPAPGDLAALTPPAVDCLSVPFKHDGDVTGALWIVSHTQRRRFDAEDLRLLEACGPCASAAYHAADHVAAPAQCEERALRRANRRKDIFIATLAHELREPAGAILSAARVLREPAGERERHRAVDALERQARHMRCLIDDVLDVTRIAEGKLELHKERVDARQIVWDACAATSALFRARQQRLSTSLPEGPVWLHADRTRLQQVMTNLLSNAAKYTQHAGEIAVVGTADAEHVDIRVLDNGLGISAELLPHVFELFAQEIPTSAGLGIGLKVVRELVELHGGSVTARSEGAGQGSEFIVRLPVAMPVR
jgi:signal transduction histidine kinase